ncbi:hypothetical protein GMOD_00004323 [Pyrenophora seminiperda CCB06]|uniref:Uncharacterized protein n=1 Tax=Pyrenophora seminiperda CCB06 TaxID=1302712 RepID=A0A3M7M107_9PLEO|nr:hypothetical protein GMOD_00004323 [Pyrenophora seminiperda CCB06]
MFLTTSRPPSHPHPHTPLPPRIPWRWRLPYSSVVARPSLPNLTFCLFLLPKSTPSAAERGKKYR